MASAPDSRAKEQDTYFSSLSFSMLPVSTRVTTPERAWAGKKYISDVVYEVKIFDQENLKFQDKTSLHLVRDRNGLYKQGRHVAERGSTYSLSYMGLIDLVSVSLYRQTETVATRKVANKANITGPLRGEAVPFEVSAWYGPVGRSSQSEFKCIPARGSGDAAAIFPGLTGKYAGYDCAGRLVPALPVWHAQVLYLEDYDFFIYIKTVDAVEAASYTLKSLTLSDAEKPSDGTGHCTQDESWGKRKDLIQPAFIEVAGIYKAFYGNGGALNNAYQRELRKTPCLSGSLLLKIGVDASGAVTALEIGASNPDMLKLAGKVGPIIQGMKFESPGRPDVFEHLIHFYPY